MSEGYWCVRCIKFVLPRLGKFLHLHSGYRLCFICNKCGEMVYLKNREGKYAV